MDQKTEEKLETVKAQLESVKKSVKPQKNRPLTHDEIQGLPKGEYTMRRGQILDKTLRGASHTLTSEGGFKELIDEYVRIMEKRSDANALHRRVIIEKIEVLRIVTKQKSEWHRIVYPFDYSGELTKILRNGYIR